MQFTFSGANTNLYDTVGARTLNLIGSNTGTGVAATTNVGFNVFSIVLTDVDATHTTALTKAGNGTWALNSTQTYGGATTINGGQLILGNGANFGASNQVATLATAVTVNAGGTLAVQPGLVANTSAALGVNGAANALGVAGTTTGGTLTLNAGSAFTMVDGILSTFTVKGASTLAPASGTSPTLTFDLSATGTLEDKLVLTGAATVGAAKDIININYIGTASPLGTYPIITAASGLTAANFLVGTSKIYVSGTPYAVSLTNTSSTTENVVISAFGSSPDVAYWTGAAGPAWNAGVTNFNTTVAGGVSASALPGANTDVFFSTTTPPPTNLTNTLGVATTINSLNFISGAGLGQHWWHIRPDVERRHERNVGLGQARPMLRAVLASVVLGGAQTWSNSGTGLLTVGSSTAGITTGGFNLTTSGTGSFALAGAITGAGGLRSAGRAPPPCRQRAIPIRVQRPFEAGCWPSPVERSPRRTYWISAAPTSAALDLGWLGHRYCGPQSHRYGHVDQLTIDRHGIHQRHGCVTATNDSNVGFVANVGAVATGNFFLTGGSFTQNAATNFYTGVNIAGWVRSGHDNHHRRDVHDGNRYILHRQQRRHAGHHQHCRRQRHRRSG